MFRTKPNALTDASLEDLYAEVLGTSEIDDIQVQFDDENGTAFSVEFVDFDDFRGFNVSGLPDRADGATLARNVDLPVEDMGEPFITFETSTDDPEIAVSQLESIAAAMGVSRDDIQHAKRRQIETGLANRTAGWIMKKFPGGYK